MAPKPSSSAGREARPQAASFAAGRKIHLEADRAVQNAKPLLPRFYCNQEKVKESKAKGLARSATCPSSMALLNTRADALQTVALCRCLITSLELTRMRKSRIGFAHWMSFWEQLYSRSLARTLSLCVTSALTKVDMLFRCVSKELHFITDRTEAAVRQAESKKDIARILENMEAEVSVHREHRRRRAHKTLERLRANMEAIPVKVTDDFYVDMKRALFCLDPFCDYHPGDPEAELRDRMRPAQFDVYQDSPMDEPVDLHQVVGSMAYTLASGQGRGQGHARNRGFVNAREWAIHETQLTANW